MYVKVHVHAGAKKESVSKRGKSGLTISVKEPAKQNLANARVVALVSTYFGVTKNKVRIISGHHSPSKMLSVDKID